MSKPYSLTKLAFAITLSFAGQSAFAQISAADANTQISHKQGVEIVNIANPSQAGLSHNRYNQFNVDKAGAVLNNALQSGKSQLAGDLAANPNLRTQSAKVILNEVVSRNPSKIAGQQEIFGDKADYVLANPNGISVQGGGFINASRASLVVGKPQVGEGQLRGYDAAGNHALTTNGKITTSGDLDLIAPQVSIGGHITSTEGVNIITGRNHITRENNGTLKISTTEKSNQILDGKVLGSIQAGRIRIHSADDRATITAQSADLQAKEIELTAGNAKLSGTVTHHVDRNHSSTTKQKGVNVHERQYASSETYHATRVQAEQLNVNVQNKLDISGAEIQAKHAQVTGGNVHLGTQKTVALSEQTKSQSKGSWYRNEQDRNRVETVHRTILSGDDVNIVATKGKVTAEGAQINAKTAALYGEQGIHLQGAKATSNQTAHVDFKNETWRLKTGFGEQTNQRQDYTATEINTQKDVVLGGKGNIHLTGVVAHVDGNLLAKNQGSLTFNAEKSTENYHRNDDMRFWGGLAGGKTLGSGKSTESVHGADITVKGNALLDASHGVQLSGSRVFAEGDGVVTGHSGALTIDSVNAQHVVTDYARKGTIFNITTLRKSQYQQTSEAQGSTLKSESNLHLVTDKNVSIVGSTIESAGLLKIATKSGIEVKGATQHNYLESHEAGFSLSGGFDSLKTTFQYGHLSANLNIDNGKGTPAVNSDVTVFTDKQESAVNAEAKFHLGLHAYNNSQNTHATTHQAASVKGGDVILDANKVGVSGSNITATKGDLSVFAIELATQADHDKTTTNTSKNDVNIGLKGTVTNKKVSGTLGVSVDHQATSDVTNQAQVSHLSANHNLVLVADRIEHEGSRIQAGDNILELAQQIHHNSAKNTTQHNGHNVNVALGVSASIDHAKAFGLETELSAKGGRESSSGLENQATQIQAGQSVRINAQQGIDDHATMYQAGEHAVFNSKQHQFTAETNHKQKDSLSAGASLGISASTADFQRFNLGAQASANYKVGHSVENNAVQGGVLAKNVDIHTEIFTSQANIQGKENVNIQAQTARFNQATDSKTQSEGGFETKFGVGAVVIPAATAVLPSIEVSASANGKNAAQTQAKLNTISGQNVNVQTQGLLALQGTNVNAENNVNLSGKRVNITAGQNSAQQTSANASVGVNIGANTSKVGLDAKVGVSLENSQTYTGVKVNGNNVNIHAQNGVNLKGVASESKQLTLDAGKGNLALTAATDHVNKTDVSVGVKLGGGIAEQKWTPSSGSADLAVNVVRNETHTETVLNTQTAHIHADGDAKFVGGSVNANQASGSIGGNSYTEQLANKVNEVGVALSANGSGKLSLTSPDKWAESAKKDWDNGTIAGVSSDISAELNVKKQQTATNAGVNAQQNHVVVKGVKTRKDMRNNHSRNLHVKVQATTNLQKVVESKLPEHVKPFLKPVRGLNVQITKNSRVDPKVKVRN